MPSILEFCLLYWSYSKCNIRIGVDAGMISLVETCRKQFGRKFSFMFVCVCGGGGGNLGLSVGFHSSSMPGRRSPCYGHVSHPRPPGVEDVYARWRSSINSDAALWTKYPPHCFVLAAQGRSYLYFLFAWIIIFSSGST